MDLFSAWEMVEADLHAAYGIEDVDDLPPDRSWRWLRARVRRLLLDPDCPTFRATTRRR